MFLLLLMILGTVNVKAQVRIGGNGAPNAAAVLDLNADDANSGTKGLALPRVSLINATTPLTGIPTVNGMLVYNTGGALTAGIYFWSGSIWNRVDDAIGNELTDTITGGGLTKSGAGTAANPWKVGIRTNGVTATMINNMGATPSQILRFSGNTWFPDSLMKYVSDSITFNHGDTIVVAPVPSCGIGWLPISVTPVLMNISGSTYFPTGASYIEDGYVTAFMAKGAAADGPVRLGSVPSRTSFPIRVYCAKL